MTPFTLLDALIYGCSFPDSQNSLIGAHFENVLMAYRTSHKCVRSQMVVARMDYQMRWKVGVYSLPGH